MNNDFLRFFSEHKDITPSDIPPEVIRRAYEGQSLGEAYAVWENGKLREEMAALRQSAENAAKAAPSSKGAGNEKRDLIDIYWDEE